MLSSLMGRTARYRRRRALENMRKRFADPLFDYLMPPILDGVTFVAAPSALYPSMRPVYSIAGTTGLSAELVDANWTKRNPKTDLLEQAILDQARIERLGARSDPTRVNINLYSEVLSNAWWLTDSSMGTVTDNAAEFVDGETVADHLGKKAGDTGTYRYHYLSAASIDDDADYCHSVFARAAEASILALRTRDQAAAVETTYFNLATGAVGTAGHSAGKYGIEEWPGGWYRCWVAQDSASGAGAYLWQILVTAADGSLAPPATTGDGTYLCGMQFEKGSAPSSYIPTGAASEQGTGDQLRYPAGANVSFTAGTILAAVTPGHSVGSNQYLFDIQANSNERISCYTSNLIPRFYVRASSVVQAQLDQTALVAGTTAVLTGTWAANDFRWYSDGGNEQSDASGSVPSGTINSIALLSYTSGVQPFGGNGTFLVFYNRPLSAAEVSVDASWVSQRLVGVS